VDGHHGAQRKDWRKCALKNTPATRLAEARTAQLELGTCEDCRARENNKKAFEGESQVRSELVWGEPSRKSGAAESSAQPAVL
jgi:hypothetical protein